MGLGLDVDCGPSPASELESELESAVGGGGLFFGAGGGALLRGGWVSLLGGWVSFLVSPSFRVVSGFLRGAFVSAPWSSEFLGGGCSSSPSMPSFLKPQSRASAAAV